jgi:glycosyltransferase involved in cell wall biosynthesis
MRVAHVLAGVDEPSAGPSHSVPSLCRGLAAQGADVELHSVAGWRGPPREDLAFAPARHRQDMAGLPGLGAFCISSDLRRSLLDARPAFAILHGHGLWLAPNIYPAGIARRTGAAVVISPRGMLGAAALRFSGARKALVWRLLQGPAARAAACFHATSEAEADEIRAAGLRAPIAVIPNGVDLVGEGEAGGDRPEESTPRTVLSLGRIHPKKGLDRLVQAWSMVEAGHPDWRLRIVGPSELGHADELVAQAARLGLSRVSVEGPAAGAAKAAAYRQADLFVLPTLNENFAMTVAEALAASVPVISTKGAPWSGLEDHGCGWWIDHGPEPLAAAMRAAMALSDAERRAMGARGRAWMARDFGWDRVAADMLDVYRWLKAGGERPPSVRVAT